MVERGDLLNLISCKVCQYLAVHRKQGEILFIITDYPGNRLISKREYIAVFRETYDGSAGGNAGQDMRISCVQFHPVTPVSYTHLTLPTN